MTIYTVKVNDNGSKEWLLDGKRHRIDGPAIEYDGTKLSKLGHKIWYLNDKLHRTDGPAVEWASGRKEWWLDGKFLTQAQWLEAVKPKVTSCVGKVVEVDGVKYRLIAA
jgi:hypothetical protein